MVRLCRIAILCSVSRQWYREMARWCRESAASGVGDNRCGQTAGCAGSDVGSGHQRVASTLLLHFCRDKRRPGQMPDGRALAVTSVSVLS